ncbi:MAG TPA: hypothetical protein VFA42_08615 [Gaiellaceae bacterium]|jgi:hypothetical protein|nr:hypothetical protein [Gaiellaceae bacterium]
MGSLSAAALVGTPIRVHGILLGRPIDLVLDAAGRRVLGFVVESGDDAPRFLPYAACQPGPDAIAVGSALMLLDDVSFYRKHGVSFRSLLGREIERENVPVGALIDVHIDRAGGVAELEVELDGVRSRLPAAGSSFAATAATAA